MKTARIFLWIILVASTACASHHQVPHTARDETQPHVTWDVLTGGAQGHERLACQSALLQTECTLAASSKERTELATIHLYLHAATLPVTYEGTLNLTFINGDAGHAVSSTVPPGASPQGPTIAGVITSKPGTYTIRVELKVKHGDNDSPLIVREVKVAVR